MQIINQNYYKKIEMNKRGLISATTLVVLAYLTPLTSQNNIKEAAEKFLGHLHMYPSPFSKHTETKKTAEPAKMSAAPSQELFEAQYRCSYMSGLNFYDLKPLTG